LRGTPGSAYPQPEPNATELPSSAPGRQKLVELQASASSPTPLSSRSAQNLYSLLPRPRVRGVERPLLCLVADAPHGDRKRPRRNAHLPRRTLQTTGVPCVEASTSTNVPPGEYTSLIIDPSVASLGLSILRLAISGFEKTPRGLGHSDGQSTSVTKICLAKSLDARREPYLGERRWFISRDFNFITSNINTM